MTDNLYFNCIGRSDCTFQFFIGGRGIGKSYSIYREIVRTGERTLGESKWLYTRLTKAETKGSCGVSNCFKDFNMINASDIQMEFSDDIGQIVQYIPFKSKDIEYETRVLGYIKSLDTFANLRGMSLADVDYIFLDEFIPELTAIKRPIHKIAGTVLRNMYETISRNRELSGRDPVRVYFSGNPNGLQSDILNSFGLTAIVARMIKEGIKRYTDRKRSIYVELCESQISALKADSAIYQIGGDDNFTRMAIDNLFPAETFRYVQNVNLPEYVPYMQYGDLCILKHKSKNTYHVRRQNSNATRSYDKNADIDRFYKDFYTSYICAVLEKRITYDTADIKMEIDNVLNRSNITY